MALNITYAAPSVVPIGSKLTISENGQYDVTDYAVANVSVSGGGGSSDLTTATLIVDNIAENPAYPEIFVPCVAEPNWDGQITSNTVLSDESDFPITVKVILYKGKARLYMAAILDTEVTLEGNITRSPDDEYAYYITGDCKITLNVED